MGGAKSATEGFLSRRTAPFGATPLYTAVLDLAIWVLFEGGRERGPQREATPVPDLELPEFSRGLLSPLLHNKATHLTVLLHKCLKICCSL